MRVTWNLHNKFVLVRNLLKGSHYNGMNHRCLFLEKYLEILSF